MEIKEVEAEIKKSWKDQAALYISAVLSPYIIIPIFIFIVCLRFSDNLTKFITYFTVCIIPSTIVPFLYVFIAVKRNKISDIHVAELAQRREPFIITLIAILLGIITLRVLNAPIEIIILGYVMLLNGIIFFIITLFWKISMHTSVLAAVVTSLMILVNMDFWVGYLLLPILIWARLRRHRHNIYQGLVAILLATVGIVILFRCFGYPK